MSHATTPLLSIIIVSYNTRDLTLQTLESVVAEVKRSPQLRHQTEIWVVDNNSTDDSVAAAKAYLRQQPDLAKAKVLANDKNLGFAAANNQALLQAQGRYFLLLNSDTIVQPSALTHLIETFEAHPIDETSAHLASRTGVLDRLGLLAPSLLNPDGSLQHQGGDLPSLPSVFVQMSFLDDLPLIGHWFHSTQHTGATGRHRLGGAATQTTLLPLGWIGGTAMMLRREVVAEIGLLDEGIFMYGEDVEYCLRATQHHWDCALDQAAHITHFGQGSSTARNAILGEFRGYLYIWAKHFPAWQLPLLKTILISGALLRSVMYKLTGRTTAAQIYADALAELT